MRTSRLYATSAVAGRDGHHPCAPCCRKALGATLACVKKCLLRQGSSKFLVVFLKRKKKLFVPRLACVAVIVYPTSLTDVLASRVSLTSRAPLDDPGVGHPPLCRQPALLERKGRGCSTGGCRRLGWPTHAPAVTQECLEPEGAGGWRRAPLRLSCTVKHGATARLPRKKEIGKGAEREGKGLGPGT